MINRKCFMFCVFELVSFSCSFVCRGGKVQKCSRWILEFTLFFSDKLKAFDRLENPTVFKYEDYDFIVIKIYIDHLHGLETENVSNYHLCELLRFIQYEGKIGKK